MDVERKLEVSKNTRQIAAESLATAFGNALASDGPISEVYLRDQWLEELRKHQHIFPDGWYLPPPHGTAVLFATETDISRINYSSLRPPENWPRKDVLLDRKSGIVYAYASPVDRESGLIGDFGTTVYLGKVPAIISHMRDCLRMNREIFNHVTVGMTFSEVSAFASELFIRNNFSNDVTSVTDPAGINIGHTVPGSYNDWTKGEAAMLRDGASNWEEALTLISKKRVFVSSKEEFVIQPGMAFTLEPRLTVVGNRDIPMSSFHTIIVIHKDGSKELVLNFSEIFSVTGMSYMKERL